MMIVTLTLGETFYLRSTIWTADRSRADEFETEEPAAAQLAKAARDARGAVPALNCWLSGAKSIGAKY